jgi:hypothetical protein
MVMKIERNAMRMAEEHGWWQRKFTSPSHSGVPDRILAKDKRVVFIEFKQPGEPLSQLQIDEINAMIDAGLEVHVCDSVNDVKKLLGITT